MLNSKKQSNFLFLIILLISLTSSLLLESEKKVFKNFSLYDVNNNLYSLEDFADKKGILILFISVQCPISNDYNSRMAELFDEFGNTFSFVGINSNKSENIEEIKEHASENNLKFKILKDSNNVVADIFEASFTPEIYVLNNKYELLYHGRIDDSKREENIEVKDLQNALSEIKAGKEVSVKKTKAFGCTIKRVSK
jgi:peroxiredoxin